MGIGYLVPEVRMMTLFFTRHFYASGFHDITNRSVNVEPSIRVPAFAFGACSVGDVMYVQYLTFWRVHELLSKVGLFPLVQWLASVFHAASVLRRCARKHSVCGLPGGGPSYMPEKTSRIATGPPSSRNDIPAL